MAIGLGRSGPQGHIGLDVDGAFLAAVEVREGRVVRAHSADLAPGVLSEGEVNDPHALTVALKEFFKRHDLPRRVRLGVANRQIAVRSLDLPPIEDEAQRQAAVRFQAADAIAMPLEEVVLDYQVVGTTTTPEGGERARIVVVAAREAMIAGLVEAVRRAGLRPEGIDLSAFALVRAVAQPSTADYEPAIAYCHLAGITNLAVAVGATCLFTRPLGPARDASGAPVTVALAEEMRPSIDYYAGQPDAPSVGEVVLSGPGAARDGVAEELGDLLGLPVSHADSLRNVDAAGLPVREDPSRHTVAAGLAMGAAA